MTATEIIKQLKQVFNDLQNKPAETPMAKEEKQNVKMTKLMNGTEIEVTEMVVGGIVTINGAPAPVGEYILEDGSAIYVGENGAIMEIKTKPEEVEEPVMNPAPEDMGKNVMKYEEEFNRFQNETAEKFKSYENKFAEYEEKLAKATKVIEGLLNLTQTLAETPTGQADPSIKAGNNFKEEKKENLDILFSN